ncbi:DoxX family protein [Marinomonas posidonica]|uniref:DoxX family protein n=1 Tax=Marinomonas posidonica (strain CECT 7376 / NCIMB 14433 / IVIA-Po-181) TaxID=491952 RepID=F6CX04_MARPP|nr:DoxX family protein [Marinomonas posidonica]AEF53258.1 DoxX family protein [Marinomonas posidonica IVIA-Po-181]
MLSTLFNTLETALKNIPESLILLIARFSLAAVFWLSAQTKIDGFAINFISMQFQLGWPHISDTTYFLFEHEYALPLLPPAFAAVMATIAEHVLAVLVLIGFLTRYAALGLALMTLVIQIFVYPDAYATHGTWLAISLLLMRKGAGKFSLDQLRRPL